MWNEADARRKIAALFAKAKGSSSAQEAMTFAAKAAELARRHNIDPASLDPDKVGGHAHKVGKRTVRTWQSWLAEAAARLNDCTTLQAGGNIIFVGRKGDSITAKLMFGYFKDVCDKAAERFLAELHTPFNRRARANSFRNSFSREILDRAEAAIADPPEERAGIVEYLSTLQLAKARKRTVAGNKSGRDAAQGVGLSRQAMGGRTLAIGCGR